MLLLAFVSIVSVCIVNFGVTQKIITVYNELDNNELSTGKFNPDVYLKTAQIIRRHGYAAETHIVETEDGFLLKVHRIPSNKNGTIGVQPVFLQHGLLGSSDDWVINENKSLAFILSDLGYDVWIGNCRGNSYSRAHTILSPDSDEFWDHSFQEMAAYDLPAVFAFIEEKTKKTGEIIYVGHSMGTTMFFAYAATYPSLAKKSVKAMVALAPVAFMNHIKSPIHYFGPFANDISWISKHFGLREFLPDGKMMELLSWECKMCHLYDAICKQVIFLICGFDSKELTDKVLEVIVSHDPAGISTKTIVHFAQEIHASGNFQEFDYGTEKNLIKYGTRNPPLYNVSNINVPMHLMYSNNDLLATSEDVYHLANLVGNYATVYKVALDSFNHIDFIWAKDAPKLVYDNLISFIKQYKTT